MEERVFKSGDIVTQFKRETLSQEEKDANMYLYKIIGIAQHSETKEKLMVYQAMYDMEFMCARPLDMFMSEVDREKYPDIKQKYRFELD